MPTTAPRPTTTQPGSGTQPGPGQYVDFDEFVDYHLDKVRKGVQLTDLLTAAAGIAALVLGYLLVFVVFDHWIVAGGFGRTARVTMLLAVVVAAIAWVVWKVVIPARRRVTALYAADVIERAEPGLAGNLRNLIDLRSAGRESSAAVTGTMEKRAALRMAEIDIDETVDRRRLLNVSYALAAVLVVGCLYVVLSPKKVSTSLWRALAPTAAVDVATRTEILEVVPGDVEILARSRLEVTVDVAGEVPEDVNLLFTTSDRRFVDEAIALRPHDDFPKRFVGTLVGENGRGILQDLEYRIVAGDATAGPFTVKVLQPPAASVEEITVVPPAYTQLPPTTRPGGHVDGIEGSTVTWTARTNQPVTRALVLFSDDETFGTKAEELRMLVGPEGRTLTATLENWAKRSALDAPPYPEYYRIQVWNERGDSDPEPTTYRIDVDLDLPPEVFLLDPTEDLVGPRARPANGNVPLTIRAKDDFGVTYVRLKVSKQGEDVYTEPIFDEEPRTVYAPDRPFVLQLNQPGRLELVPGDVIEVTLQARDNKHRGAELRAQTSRETTPLRIEIAKPVDPAQLDRQRKQDDARRERRLDEHRRENGEEQGEPREGQPGDGEAGEPGEGNPQPADGNPQPGENPGDPANRDPAGNDPQNANPAEQGQPGDTPPPGEGTNPENRPADQRPLDRQGNEDDLATQELLDRFNADRENPPADPMGDTPKPTENPADQPAGDDPMNRDPMPAEPMDVENVDPMNPAQPAPQPGDPPPTDPGTPPQPGDTPTTPQPGEGTDPAQPQPNEGTDPQPGDATTQPKPADGGADPQPGDNTTPPKPGDANTEPKPGDGTQPMPGEGTEPKPGDASTEPKPGDAATEPKPGEGTTQPKPGEGGEPKPGDAAQPKPGDGSDDRTPEQKLNDEINELEQIAKDPAKREAVEDDLQRLLKERDRRNMTPEQLQEEIDRLQKQRANDPTAGPKQPGDPKTPEQLEDDIEQLQKIKQDKNETAPGEPKPGDPKPGEPMSKDPQPGDPNPGDPQSGDPMPAEPQPGEGTDAPMPGTGDEPQPGDAGAPEPGEAGTDPKPGDPQPGDGDTGQSMPGDAGPPQPGEAPNGDPEPGDGEIGQPKPGDTGDQPMPGEPMPGDAKPGDPKPGDAGTPEPGDMGQPKPGDASQPGDAAQPKPGNAPMPGDAGTPKPGDAPMPGDAAEPKPGDAASEPKPGDAAAEPKPGDPKSGDPSELTDQQLEEAIENLEELRKDPAKRAAAERELEERLKDRERRNMSRRELDEELDRLSRRLEDDPRAQPKPGDPETPEGLREEIEKLARERQRAGEKEAQPQPGDTPKPGDMGQPKPGDMGQPMPGEPKPGEGGEPQPGEGQPKPGEGQPQPGEGAGQPKPGEGQPGANGKPNGQPGTEVRQPGDGPGERGGAAANGGAATAAPEVDPDVESARKATELALGKLEDDMKRGEVDSALLERLGWNEQDLANYLDRMKQRFGTLDEPQPAPESEARKRQFEELLKGLDFRSDSASRKARTDRERKVDGFGGRDVPPPAEYREAADAFSRALPKLFEEAKPRKDR